MTTESTSKCSHELPSVSASSDAPDDRSLSRHEFYLVYPFKSDRHEISSLSMWEHFATRLDDAKIERENHDSYAFLPHVRASHYNRYISEGAVALSRIAKSYEKETSCVRLTLKRRFHIKYFPRRITVYRADKTHFSVDVEVGWADIILYPPGFGFLIYKFATVGLTVEQAGVVHRSIKKVYFRERLRVEPAKLHIIGYVAKNWQSLLGSLLVEFGVDTSSDYAQAHASSFRVVSLAIVPGVANDGKIYGNLQGSEEGHLISLITGEELAKDSHPGNDLVEIARTTGRLDYWRDWSGIFLWDDVAFLGAETKFTTKYLVHNVESLYMPLFVYALYQYLRLNEISVSLTELSAEAREDRNRVLKKLEKLNSDLRFFRSNYLFWEVSRQPVMAALFQHLVDHFGSGRLFNQIEHDIERLYLQERTVTQERLASFVGLATFFALPVGALLATFSSSVGSFFHYSWSRWILLVLVGVVSMLGWLLASNRLAIPPKDRRLAIWRRFWFGTKSHN